jgi:hypothetical protein
MKLALNAQEQFSWTFSQQDFEKMCPNASRAFDQIANCTCGVPNISGSLGELGRWISDAGRMQAASDARERKH